MEILNLNINAEEALQSAIDSLSLNNYGLFYVVLKKHANFHLYCHLVDDPQRTAFSATDGGLRYQLIDNQVLTTDIPGISCYEFYLRFSIDGFLNEHDERGHHSSKKPFTLTGIARVHHYSNVYGISHEHLVLYDESQYRMILDERELNTIRVRLGWTDLSGEQYHGQDAVNFFTGIWQKALINPDDQTRKKQLAEHTSLYFYNDLERTYRSVVDAVLHAKRLQPYVGSFKDHYYPNHGSRQYYIENNIFLSRHMEFLSNAIGAIYTFWERLAFLTSLYLTPAKLKTNSFVKLFKNQLNVLKQRFPSIAQNVELEYLAGRVTGRHADLMRYRHPLNHYQYQEAINRGNMHADHFRLMLQNISNEEELENLYKKLEERLDFACEEVVECKLGFLHTINLLRMVQEPI